MLKHYTNTIYKKNKLQMHIAYNKQCMHTYQEILIMKPTKSNPISPPKFYPNIYPLLPPHCQEEKKQIKQKDKQKRPFLGH